MLYHRLRIALIFFFFGLGLLLHIKNGLADAWYLYAGSLLLLITHFLFGTIRSALAILKRGDYLSAELMLSKTKYPNWLWKGHQAYFHFAHGIISLQKKELSKGKFHFQKAGNIGLKDAKDNALNYLNLAHISYVQKEVLEAKKHLKTAQSFQTDDLIVKENLEKLEAALSKMN